VAIQQFDKKVPISCKTKRFLTQGNPPKTGVFQGSLLLVKFRENKNSLDGANFLILAPAQKHAVLLRSTALCLYNMDFERLTGHKRSLSQVEECVSIADKLDKTAKELIKLRTEVCT
jgi:hypothetical protein